MPARKKKMLELAGSGDDGSTGLLGGGRARKDDPRIEAYGTVDEASSAVGLAKSLSPHPRVRTICEELQRGLYNLGAELATNPASATSFARVGEPDVKRLDALIGELEQSVTMPAGFILPGATPASGALDVARAVTRRAERRCVALERANGLKNQHVRRWLNRLSLLLFVLGRYEEALAGSPAAPAKPAPRH
ncbi:MAG TPA: cob(I)yrinic acid a,c-diamide adenosyltransferase [Candidatus Dormibacteraeota bacterium]|nr:cob(I)yrinic acid a,c-diamide adenosyltransferase [Candidatus Dormibacteraeota bacterium]